jgi:hypothetical protein
MLDEFFFADFFATSAFFAVKSFCVHRPEWFFAESFFTMKRIPLLPHYTYDMSE